MSSFSHHELEELLAPYALDAVAEDEADAVELHLRDCPRCRATVAEFRDTAGHLAAGHAPAPAGVWDAIVGSLEAGEPEALDLARVIPLRGRRPLRAMAFAAVAAAVVVIAALSAQVVSQDGRLREMQLALQDRGILSAALAAEGDPDARRAELLSADGVVLANVVITHDGTGFLRTSSLRALPADRTYQLWAVIGTERISAGVLGPEPEVVPFRVAGEVIGLAVTEEVAGGVVASQNQPVASGLLVEA